MSQPVSEVVDVLNEKLKRTEETLNFKIQEIKALKEELGKFIYNHSIKF